MRLFLLFTLLLFLCLACDQEKAVEKGMTREIRYSAFSWAIDEVTNKSYFYLGHYIEIDKRGRFKQMKRDLFMSKPRYSKGILPDTVCRLIENTFSNNQYQANYTYGSKDGVAYDGFTYCFEVRERDSLQGKKILFVPYKAPEQIQTLAQLIELVTSYDSEVMTDTFSTYGYQKELMQYYPRLDVKLERIKFSPPSRD